MRGSARFAFMPLLLPLLLGAAASNPETLRWQTAIDAAAAKGGGVVTVPPGRHLVGQLDLRSNVELRMERGAVLEGAVGLEHYRVTTLPYSEGTWSAVVSGVGVTNVAITGEGEIFGNGTAWPQPEGYGGNQEGLRPRGVFFADSRDIRLEGFTLRDAACWGVVLKCCDGVVARRVRVDSHANANNDGFDIEARNVLVADCDIDSGDDGICLKSNNPHFTVENVLVTNVVSRSHCSALKIGTASHGTVRRIRFVDCRTEAPRRDFTDRRSGRSRPWFVNAERLAGLPGTRLSEGAGMSAIVVQNVDGGTVEDVVFRNIVAEGTMTPIFLRAGRRTGRSCGTPPSDACVFRKVTVENVRGRALSGIASSVTGVADCRIRDVTFRNVRLTCCGLGASADVWRSRAVPECVGDYPYAYMFLHPLPAYGLYVRHVDGLELANCAFELEEGSSDSRKDVLMEDATVRVMGRDVFVQAANYDRTKIAPYGLENPLAFADGRKVGKAGWPQRRREILDLFAREMFGRQPPDPETVETVLDDERTAVAGFAIRRLYRMWFRGDRSGPCVNWIVWSPRYAKNPVPVTLFLNYGGNHTLVPDKDIPLMRSLRRYGPDSQLTALPDEENERLRGRCQDLESDTVFPVGMLLSRGYAVMSACYCEVSPDPDIKERNPNRQQEPFAYTGVFGLWGERDPSRTDDVTAIGAWAWALSRGLDLAGRIPGVDAGRSVVTGCSRLGKAALLAAVRDERFAVCVPVQTGGGGVPLAKRDFGENVSTENRMFTHWYCKAYAKYAREPWKTLPFDQHLLLACIAPRALLVEGFDSNWFDPEGEFLSVRAASQVWEMLCGEGMPAVDWPDDYETSAIGRYLGFVRRSEKHGIAAQDWTWMLDFADRALVK